MFQLFLFLFFHWAWKFFLCFWSFVLHFGSLKFPDAVSKFNISLNLLFKFLLEVKRFELLHQKLFANELIFFFNLLYLLFVLIPVAAWDILEFVAIECADWWLDVPDLFKQKHVLFFEMVLAFLLFEDFGCGFWFSEGDWHLVNLLFPLFNNTLFLVDDWS